MGDVMVLPISVENQNSLASRTIDVRDFISFFVKTRDTGVIVEESLWSDIGNITAPVLNPATGTSQDRAFRGAYGLISIDNIPRVHNISVQKVNIKLSQVSADVDRIIRLYEAKQARVEIFRGLFQPRSRLLVSPAFPRFVGFIDTVTVTTPPENSDGYVEVACSSHTVEMTRANTETRSHGSQKMRDPDDDFYIDTGVVGDWEYFWGKAQAKPVTTEDDDPTRRGIRFLRQATGT